jgi:aquaporin Z
MKSGRTPENTAAMRPASCAGSLRRHWPEYLMEAAALGIFMVSAGAFTTLFEYPGSPVHRAMPNADARRALIGVAMGVTAMGLIYSPWGRRSGAHMNPAITLTFLRLRKIPPWDAFFYVVFQFLGGLAGVLLTALALGRAFTQLPVDYVATVPGPLGHAVAFFGEFIIAVIMMGMVMIVSNKPAIAHLTGLFSGLLIISYVFFEAPLSGFGMNPARTFASALPGGVWTAIWIYFTAAPAGMLLAAEVYLAAKSHRAIRCCKLHHRSRRPCIFCGYHELPPAAHPAQTGVQSNLGQK